MKKSLFINFAVIIVSRIEIFDHILKYLHKFNIKDILIIKKKKLKLNKTIIKKYKFNFQILKLKDNDNLYKILQSNQKKLPNFFFSLDTESFLNQNLFDLKDIIKKNPKKLIYFKNKNLISNLRVLDKKRLKFYNNVEKKKLPKENCKMIKFKKDQFLILNKDKNKKKIQNFFKNIYSKSIILDRDGVINENFGYISEIKNFKWINGSLKAIKYLNKKKQNIFVATNQSGVARGYYSEKKVQLLHEYIKDVLQKKNCYINEFYYCPYHSKAKIKKYRKNSNLRKPKNGMFLEILKDWNINKKNTFIIGDQLSDIEFAKNSKVKGYLFDKKNLFSFIKKFPL